MQFVLNAVLSFCSKTLIIGVNKQRCKTLEQPDAPIVVRGWIFTVVQRGPSPTMSTMKRMKKKGVNASDLIDCGR